MTSLVCSSISRQASVGMASTRGQFVDPRVSRMKFEREIAEYRSYEEDYRARGWFLLKAEWPEVIVSYGFEKDQPACDRDGHPVRLYEL